MTKKIPVLPALPLTQLAFHSCDKDHGQQQPGDGRIYLILQLIGHTPLLREVIAIEECCWFVIHGSNYLLSCIIQNHLPRVALPTMAWALTHQSSIKKILCMSAHRPIWLRHFLS